MSEDTLMQLQSEMARIVRTIVQLRKLLDGLMEYVRIWLRQPHPVHHRER